MARNRGPTFVKFAEIVHFRAFQHEKTVEQGSHFCEAASKRAREARAGAQRPAAGRVTGGKS